MKKVVNSCNDYFYCLIFNESYTVKKVGKLAIWSLNGFEKGISMDKEVEWQIEYGIEKGHTGYIKLCKNTLSINSI